MILIEKKLPEHFTKNNCKEQFKKSLELKKEEKWKGYNNSFTSWIEKNMNE